MQISIIVIGSLFFSIMGIVALLSPTFVTGLFGEAEIGADMRNEVRAVYGGFGLAIGALLLLSLWFPGVQNGILLTVGVALLGMALGRLTSFLIEPAVGKFPLVFTFVEVLFGSTALFACWETIS